MADEADGGTKGRPIVLVVEDDAQVRLMIEVALTDEGFFVLEAATADDARVLLEANSDVRVLLTDVEMPGSIDGFTLAHAARAASPSMGVIVCSARIYPDEGAMPVGAQFLQKPVRPSTLVSLVSKLAGM